MKRKTLLSAQTVPTSSEHTWIVIVNPVSANGKTGRRWPHTEQVLRRALPPFDVVRTVRPGHAQELAYQAVAAGYEVLAVHGGDGTLNEAVNGFLNHPANKRAAIAILPHGTGSDFARTIGVPRSPAKAAERTKRASVQPVDVGLMRFQDLEGNRSTRYFLNVADVGFGGALTRKLNDRSKRWGGTLTYLKGLLVTLFRYENKNIRLALDENPPFKVRCSSIVLANGQYFGGGMWVAPRARLDSGQLEVIIIGDVSRSEVLTNIGKLYRGTLETHPKVRTHSAKKIVLESDEEVPLEVDGEPVGQLPVEASIIPKALNVLY